MDTATKSDRNPDHDPHAAGLARAAALRALHNYRAARDRAEYRGVIDATLLIEAPKFMDIDGAYERVLEEFIDQHIESVRAARSAIDLLTAMISDQQTGEILDEGPPVSIEKDRGDALRLLAKLSSWVNNIDIAEAIEQERAGRQ